MAKDKTVQRTIKKIDKNRCSLQDGMQIIHILLDTLDINLCDVMAPSFDKYNSVLDLLKYAESVVGEHEGLDRKQLAKIIAKEKEKIIKTLSKIKDESVNTRYSPAYRKEFSKKVAFLKGIVDRLELLEVSVVYSSLDEAILVNHDIVNNIIFEERNLSRSNHLITRYPYMINLYNNGESILDKVIDNYLSLVFKYAKEKCDKKDLYYYDNILETLLSTEKIKVDQEDINRHIEIIKTKFKEENLNGKEYERLTLWLNHLVTILFTRDYALDLETLNHLYGIREYFKKAIIDEASLYLLVKKPKEAQEDEYILTIDSSNTNNRDDGISISKNEAGNYLLNIYIADPNSYFNMKSLVMTEVKKRSQSIYLNDKTIEMFPPYIVTNHLSLDEGKSRYTRVYKYEISPKGEVVSFKIDKQVKKISDNLTYDKVNKILDTGESDLKCFKSICLLQELKGILQSKTIKNIIISENDPNDCEIGSSEELVALFMIFNNYQVAKYFKENNLPFIYRCHSKTKKLDSIICLDSLNDADKENFQSIIDKLENLNLSAEYSADNTAHEALGLDYYSHTTSPNRRFSDIIAASCQDKFYFNKPTDKEAYEYYEELKEDINYLNRRNMEILEYYKKYTRVR